jgi:hypothetical protein
VLPKTYPAVGQQQRAAEVILEEKVFPPAELFLSVHLLAVQQVGVWHRLVKARVSA